MLDQKVLYAIGREKITDNHFRLDLAIGITFFRKRDIDPAIEIAGELVGIAQANGAGDVIEGIVRIRVTEHGPRTVDPGKIDITRRRIQRAKGNQGKRTHDHGQPKYAFHVNRILVALPRTNSM